MSLTIVPVTFREACSFIEIHHRHHQPPRGMKFAVAVADRDRLVGVAIVGRPVARLLDDGVTAEVTRTCTIGAPNANSILYGAAWRAARALGYRRLVTYTQEGESGASLRAAGLTPAASLNARPGWSTPARCREDHGGDRIRRTRWEIRVTESGGLDGRFVAVVRLARLNRADPFAPQLFQLVQLASVSCEHLSWFVMTRTEGDGSARDDRWTFDVDVRWVHGEDEQWLTQELASVLRDLLRWARDDRERVDRR